MSMWHTVLQDASYKGVLFDVVSLDESDGKALAEHARPFVSGTVLEDMGTTGRQVQVSAVFWGKGYHSRLQRLLETLAEPGAGVLVHPVWGRLNQMVATGWQYRHDADNIDYATIDITFRESGTPQKIFVFENQFLMELEKLTADIDRYRALLEGFIDSVMAAKVQGGALTGSMWGFIGAVRGVFGAVRAMFDLDVLRFGTGGSGRVDARGLARLQQTQNDMCRTGLWQAAGIDDTGQPAADGSRNAKQRLDALALQQSSLHAIPQRQWVGLSGSGLGQGVSPADMALIALLMRLNSAGVLVQAALALIELEYDTATAPDLMHMQRLLRRQIRAEIQALRAWLAQSGGRAEQYEHTQNLVEQLRQMAGQSQRFITAAINQKPPLIVRPAPHDGTVQQIAFAFYGDIGRSAELVRLNPHIVHPNFIRKGEYINGYAR